jgi:hypothetical protein
MRASTLGTALIVAGSLTMAITGTATAISGCSVVNSPVFGKLENIVLQDILNGDSDGQIEVDVATALGLEEGGVTQAVVAIVVDVTQLLIDAGLIPARVLPATQGLHDREVWKLKALNALGGH